MPAPIRAQRLMIYLGESDSWRGRSLYLSILETLRKTGIAGATVTRALAGYGAHSRIRTSTIEVLSTDLPIVISIIDTQENVEKALTLVSPMVREGLITREDVDIIKYTHRYLQPLPADHPVSEFMTRIITTVQLDTPAVEIAELLLGKHLFKAVPVVDQQNHVAGIITNSDLLSKAGMPARLGIGERLEAADLQKFLNQISREKNAQTVMTSHVITIREDEALGHAVQTLVARNLKRMPVIDSQDRLVGMISRLDILRAVAGNGTAQQEQAPQPHPGHTLKELMSTKVPIVHINDDLADILQQILNADIKRVIVLDEQEKPVGIITDGDLVARVKPAVRASILQALAARVMGTDVGRGQSTARDLMSEKVLLATGDMNIAEAVNLMLHEARKLLVVVDDQSHPIGIVDRQTLMAASLGTSLK